MNENNKKLHLGNKMDLDDLLGNALPEIPPEDITRAATPWKSAFRLIIIGLLLRLVTFQFYGLQILLPAIGAVLLFLGFRSLRKENRFFQSCLTISAILLGFSFLYAILSATVYAVIASTVPALTPLGYAGMLLTEALFICFGLGIREVLKKTGTKASISVFSLALWYAVLALLTFFSGIGGVSLILMLFALIALLIHLYRLSRTLDEKGYDLTMAENHMPNPTFALILGIVLLIGLFAGSLFFGRYPMNWMPESWEADNGSWRARLLSLGYPEEALNDISAGDYQILCLQDAEAITVSENIVSFAASGSGQTCRIRLTNVAIRNQGDSLHWVMIYHFRFLDDTSFPGREEWDITFTSDSFVKKYLLTDFGLLCGRVLEDRKGETYEAQYYSLGSAGYQSSAFGWQSTSGLHAAFSFSSLGEHQRGYVAYRCIWTNPNPMQLACGENFYHQARRTYPIGPAAAEGDLPNKKGPFGRAYAFYVLAADEEEFRIIDSGN